MVEFTGDLDLSEGHSVEEDKELAALENDFTQRPFCIIRLTKQSLSRAEATRSFPMVIGGSLTDTIQCRAAPSREVRDTKWLRCGCA